jgi:GxxExxY protein
LPFTASWALALLESTYEACLDAYLTREGLEGERQVTMPLVSMDQQLDCAYRIDLLVERQVVVELKTVTQLSPVHFAQMMTYLKLSACQVGHLINFNVAHAICDSFARCNTNCPIRPRAPNGSRFT